jgi:hypothetical protein
MALLPQSFSPVMSLCLFAHLFSLNMHIIMHMAHGAGGRSEECLEMFPWETGGDYEFFSNGIRNPFQKYRVASG